MKSIVITFRSITLAQRGERVLKNAGMGCTLQRTPRWMEERGCGYCLRMHRKDVAAAVNLLRQNQVIFSKIYCLRQDGQGEEMVL